MEELSRVQFSGKGELPFVVVPPPSRDQDAAHVRADGAMVVLPPSMQSSAAGSMGCGMMGKGSWGDMGCMPPADASGFPKGMGGKSGMMGDSGWGGASSAMQGLTGMAGNFGMMGNHDPGDGSMPWMCSTGPGAAGFMMGAGLPGASGKGGMGEMTAWATENVSGMPMMCGKGFWNPEPGTMDVAGAANSGGIPGLSSSASATVNVTEKTGGGAGTQPQKSKSSKNADRYSNMLDALMQGSMLGMMGGDTSGSPTNSELQPLGSGGAGAAAEGACFGGLEGLLQLDEGGCLAASGLASFALGGALGAPLGLGAETDALGGIPVPVGGLTGHLAGVQGGASLSVPLGPEIDNNCETARFCDENGVDEGAKRILLNEAPEVQAAVLDRGSLHGCKNPSAALMGRLRDARQQARQGELKPARVVGGQGALAVDPQDESVVSPEERQVSDQVEKFIAENRIDVSAARTLRMEGVDVQRAVVARGDTVGAVNPSAAVMCRIKEYKSGRIQAQAQANAQAKYAAAWAEDEGKQGLDVRKKSRSSSRQLRRASRSANRGGGAAGGRAKRSPRRSRSGGRGGAASRRARSRSHSRRRPRSAERRRDGAGGR